MFTRKKKKAAKLEFEPASDVTALIKTIVQMADEFKHVRVEQVYCVRSHGSKARAYARTWGLSRIFQETAGYKPVYVIEIISKYYDKLAKERQVRVLLHELMHIPKTFSGALLAHRGAHHRIDNREVDKVYRKIMK